MKPSGICGEAPSPQSYLIVLEISGAKQRQDVGKGSANFMKMVNTLDFASQMVSITITINSPTPP